MTDFTASYLIARSVVAWRSNFLQISNTPLIRQFDHAIRFARRYWDGRSPLCCCIAEVDDIQSFLCHLSASDFWARVDRLAHDPSFVLQAPLSLQLVLAV